MKKTISLLLTVVMIITSLLILPTSAQAAQTRNGPSKTWLIENREALKDYLLDWGKKSSEGTYYLGYYTGDKVYDEYYWAITTNSDKKYYEYGIEYFPSTNTLQLFWTYKNLWALDVGGKPASRMYFEHNTTLDIPVNSIKNLNYKRTEIGKDYVKTYEVKKGEVFENIVKTAKINPVSYTRNTEIEVVKNGFFDDAVYKNAKETMTGLLDNEMEKWTSMLKNINYDTSANTTIVGLGFSKYCTSHYDTTKTVKPTCKSKGYTRHTCEYCNTYYDDNFTKTTGHNTKTVTTKATYAKAGKQETKCTVCGKVTSTKKLAKLTVPKIILSSVKSKKSKQITVAWKKNTKVTGYQIECATDSKFTKNKKTVTVSKNSTTSKNISKLKSKTKYYVRVRAYKVENGKKYYSSWSSAKSVTTKK